MGIGRGRTYIVICIERNCYVVSETQTIILFLLYFPLTEAGIRGPTYSQDKHSGPTLNLAGESPTIPEEV
jgi:hypothetical protein